MKKNMLLLVVFLLFSTFSSFAQGIEFEHTSWEEVKAKAAKENKPIFVDAYTTWCGPCKWMSKNTFPQKEVGDYMNKNFVSVKLDMEKGDGIEFRKKYEVNVFPTLLYFSSAGELIHKGVGAMDTKSLLALSKDAIDPSKQLMSLKKKYEAGNKDPEFIKAYLIALISANEPSDKVFNAYWTDLPKEAKLSEENLNIAAEATGFFSDLSSPAAQFFLQNREAYKKNESKKGLIDEYSNISFSRILWSIGRIKDEVQQKETIAQLNSHFPNNKKEIQPCVDYQIALATENPKIINKALNKYAKVSSNSNFLNSIAWRVFETEDGKKELKNAIKWVERSIALDKNYANVDTKAALLFKLGKYADAKNEAEDAIKMAEDEGIDATDTEELLKQINAKL